MSPKTSWSSLPCHFPPTPPTPPPPPQEMFEQVNKAYEFLCSKAKVKDGPDPQNIVLILKAQSILFSRYKEGRWRN